MAGVDYLEWDSAKHNYHPWMDSMMHLPAQITFGIGEMIVYGSSRGHQSQPGR